MKAVRFSIVVFAPWLVLHVVPIPVIPLQGLAAVLMLLCSFATLGSDPPIVETLQCCFWSFAPLAVALVFLSLGANYKYLFNSERSQRRLGTLTWLITSVWLFLFAAYFATLLFNVSMAVVDGGLPVLIDPVALASVGITIAGQVLIIPW